jgi:hypothetical protein
LVNAAPRILEGLTDRVRTQSQRPSRQLFVKSSRFLLDRTPS